MKIIKTVLFALLCFLAFVTVSQAGGGEYEGADDSENAGPAYFGFVRDDKGSNLAAAKVTLLSKSGIKVDIKSNVLGVYRSHISKDIKPEDVSLLCEKDGYQQVRIVKRSNSSGRVIEADCIMQKK